MAKAVLNPQIVCPYCHQRGVVDIVRVSVKRGVSGGKLVAFILTAGLSIFFVGLSRKERHNRFFCHNCHLTWVGPAT
jgi:transposase-like protein